MLRNIKLNYIQMFLRNFNVTHVVWLLFLASKGFSLFEIGIFEGIFHLTSLTLEIPTGVIADLYSRKLSRLLGVASYILYLGIMLLSDSFLVVSIGFVFCGLSYTLESGAGEALVYDSLLEAGKEKEFERVQANLEIIFQIANVISAFIAGYIAMMNYDYIFLMMIFVYLTVFAVIIMMRETNVQHIHEDISHKWKHQYVDSVKYILKHKELFLYVIMISLFTFPVTVAFFYMQNQLDFLGYETTWITVILGLHSLSSAIGAYYITKRSHSDRTILLIFPLVQLIFLWTLATQISFIGIILLGAIDSILFITFSARINDMIPSNKRATILSISGMTFSLLMVIVFPLVGLVIDTYGYRLAFMFNAMFATVAYLIYFTHYRGLNNVKRETERQSL